MATKVFVGNLSFDTDTETLTNEFSAAGKVLNVNIITNGPRSRGYGFVELASLEDANNAVALLNQKQIDGREVKVEIAHLRSTQEDREPPSRRYSDGNNWRRPNFRDNSSGGVRRNYRPRQPYQQEGQEEGSSFEFAPRRRPYYDGNSGPGYYQRGYRPSRPQQPRQFQQRRGPSQRPQQERVASETSLFVANLPFGYGDTELAEIFSGLSVVSAHVVTKRNGKSKGFGFVEFANNEEQQKALEQVTGKQVDGRELNVKVALTVVPGSGAAEDKDAPDTATAQDESEEKQEAADGAPEQPHAHKEEGAHPAAAPAKEAPKPETPAAAPQETKTE